MQLCNVTLRLGGSVLHTVPKTNVTPGEILVLQRIHGGDAVVDIRPTKFDKKIRQADDWERLSLAYDRSSSFAAAPGEESKSIMQAMFPGAMKKLPTTLKEIGLGHLDSPAAKRAADAGAGAAAPDPQDEDLDPDAETELDQFQTEDESEAADVEEVE